MNPRNMTTSTGDIRDIKGLEHFSYSPIYYIIPALLLACLIYFAWRLYKKRRERINIETILPPSPDEVALRELDLLRNEDYFEEIGEKLFNFRLSEIFRNYLEGRYEFPASEMTSEEIVSYIEKKNLGIRTNNQDSKNEEQEIRLKEVVKKILVETDKVKFAKFRPGKKVAMGLTDNAIKFINETKKRQESTQADACDYQTNDGSRTL